MRRGNGVRRGLVLFVLMLPVACRQQVFEPVRDGLVATGVLSGEVRVVTKADLLFVVDDSPSMVSEQEKLARGFPALADALDALDPPVDWRVAVMTTSVDERFGPCAGAEPGASASCAAAFGGSGFSCELGACVRRFGDRAGRLHVATGSEAVLARSRLSREELLQRFDANVHVGTDGARQEQPLRSVRLALETGGLSELLRPDARLVVVIATDEDDCSDTRGRLLALEDNGGRIVDRCAEESVRDTGMLDDVEAWARWMTSRQDLALGVVVGLDDATGEPGRCRDASCVAACAGPAQTGSCETQCRQALRPSLCLSECLEQCASFCGSDAPGRRLARAAAALGGRRSSVCASDYGPALASLARVMGIPDAIDLPGLPRDDRSTFFEVRRAGRPLSCVVGTDFTVDRSSSPARLLIEPLGACRLLPDDAWTIRFLRDVGE